MSEGGGGKTSWDTVSKVATFLVAMAAFAFGIMDPMKNESRITALETRQTEIIKRYDREHPNFNRIPEQP